MTLIKPILLNTGARQEEGKFCEASAQIEGSVFSGKVPQESFHGSLHPLSLSQHSQEHQSWLCPSQEPQALGWEWERIREGEAGRREQESQAELEV